jgi:hypothetical protein
MRSRKPIKRSHKCRRGIRKSDGRCKRKPGPKPKRSRKPRKSRKNKRYNFKVGEDSDQIDDVKIFSHGWDVGAEFQIPERVQSVTYLKTEGCYYEDLKNVMETKYTNQFMPNILIGFFGQSIKFDMKITINEKSITVPSDLVPLSELIDYILKSTKNKVKITVNACRSSNISGLYNFLSKEAKEILDSVGKLEKTKGVSEEMTKKQMKPLPSSKKYVPPHKRKELERIQKELERMQKEDYPILYFS